LLHVAVADLILVARLVDVDESAVPGQLAVVALIGFVRLVLGEDDAAQPPAA